MVRKLVTYGFGLGARWEDRRNYSLFVLWYIRVIDSTHGGPGTLHYEAGGIGAGDISPIAAPEK